MKTVVCKTAYTVKRGQIKRLASTSGKCRRRQLLVQQTQYPLHSRI